MIFMQRFAVILRSPAFAIIPNQQTRPKGTGYVVLIRYLYPGFNTFYNRHKSPPRKRVLGY
jgi:hypothetical protein